MLKFRLTNCVTSTSIVIFGIVFSILANSLPHSSVQAEENHEAGKSYFGKDADENCDKDSSCENQMNIPNSKKCLWGYEDGCTNPENWFIKPDCDETRGYTRTRWETFDEKLQLFWTETDFGIVKQVRDNLSPVCKSETETESSLFCNDDLTYCEAKNLYMDLRDDGRSLAERFKNEETFKQGRFGGKCELSGFKGKHLSRMKLTSWIAELEHYSSLPFNPVTDGHCDVIVEKPTFFMKLDALVNMYHHFCDFFNLYITQHVNGSFETDIYIALWEGNKRRSLGNFSPMWSVFTHHPVMYLGSQYHGKRVCFKNAIFALLPRMVFGLYYNTPIMPGCSKSGLFKAFSEHVLGRLKIQQERQISETDKPIRVTLLSRQTKWRRILNEDELVVALSNWSGVEFKMANYSWSTPFLDQLKITQNSDVFIGMHGAGLAHALFLPDWAVLFELYNCEDDRCYKDLAHIRGLNYITWENKDKLFERTEELHPQYGDHLKFRNYAFDVQEFMRLAEIAVNQARKNLAALAAKIQV